MHQIMTLALQGGTISYLDEEMLKKEAVSFVGKGHWVEKYFFSATSIQQFKFSSRGQEIFQLHAGFLFGTIQGDAISLTKSLKKILEKSKCTTFTFM